MNKSKILLLIFVAVLSLSSCVQSNNNSSLSEDMGNASDSVSRFFNGVFFAQVENFNVETVDNATMNALDSSHLYFIKNNEVHTNSAQITGTTKNTKVDFKIDLQQTYQNKVNISIKMGTFGDKRASVYLLSQIRSNLGI
jgi:hypothetical protein